MNGPAFGCCCVVATEDIYVDWYENFGDHNVERAKFHRRPSVNIPDIAGAVEMTYANIENKADVAFGWPNDAADIVVPEAYVIWVTSVKATADSDWLLIRVTPVDQPGPGPDDYNALFLVDDTGITVQWKEDNTVTAQSQSIGSTLASNGYSYDLADAGGGIFSYVWADLTGPIAPILRDVGQLGEFYEQHQFAVFGNPANVANPTLPRYLEGDRSFFLKLDKSPLRFAQAERHSGRYRLGMRIKDVFPTSPTVETTLAFDPFANAFRRSHFYYAAGTATIEFGYGKLPEITTGNVLDLEGWVALDTYSVTINRTEKHFYAYTENVDPNPNIPDGWEEIALRRALLLETGETTDGVQHLTNAWFASDGDDDLEGASAGIAVSENDTVFTWYRLYDRSPNPIVDSKMVIDGTEITVAPDKVYKVHDVTQFGDGFIWWEEDRRLFTPGGLGQPGTGQYTYTLKSTDGINISETADLDAGDPDLDAPQIFTASDGWAYIRWVRPASESTEPFPGEDPQPSTWEWWLYSPDGSIRVPAREGTPETGWQPLAFRANADVAKSDLPRNVPKGVWF